MKIAVFGSWKKSGVQSWKPQGSQREFRDACEALGRKIAEYRHSIIVQSDFPNTADFCLAKGVIDEAKGWALDYPLIKVITLENKKPSLFEGLAREHPHVFEFSPQSQPFWQAAHLIAIREADVVTVIGGAKASYCVGLAAIISGKRLVPVGCFGGAGERLLRILESVSDREKGADLRMLNGPWSDLALQTTLKTMGLDDYPRVLIIHGRSDEWISLKDYLQNVLHLPEPIVMGQKFGDGRTLPEKFEDLASDVDAAIGLATPDDMGGLGVDMRGGLMGQQRIRFSRRARQNVWLEIGWFWGSLGRSRIMMLCRGKIELPSDLQGIELYFYGKEPRERGDQIRLFVDKLRGLTSTGSRNNLGLGVI